MGILDAFKKTTYAKQYSMNYDKFKSKTKFKDKPEKKKRFEELSENALRQRWKKVQSRNRAERFAKRLTAYEKGQRRASFDSRQPRAFRALDKYSARYKTRPRGAVSKVVTKPSGERVIYYRKGRTGTTGRVALKRLLRGRPSPRGYSMTRRRVGRPAGPTGTYTIKGRPVGVYEWRRYQARLRALRRLQQASVSGYTPEPDYGEYSYQEQQMEQQEYPQAPVQRYQMPQRNQIQQVERPEQNYNILNAPNIMKNELHGVGRYSAMKQADTMEKPITNPTGDYYTEVDPISGRQILRIRPREKWAS